MVPLNEAGGLLGKLLRCPTSMVTGQSTCQTAEQAYNSQTDRDVGVSTLASQKGGGTARWYFAYKLDNRPPSRFYSLYFSFRLPGSGSQNPFHERLSLQSRWNFVVKLEMFPTLCFQDEIQTRGSKNEVKKSTWVDVHIYTHEVWWKDIYLKYVDV